MSSDSPETVGANATNIFLSYARADRPRVAPIVSALEAAGLTIWWDALIEGGAAFAKTIEDALEAADAVVVLWSKTSITSDWVRDEAGRGRDLKKLVPVSLDGVDPPMGFRQYHFVNLAAWDGKANAPEIGDIVRGVGSVSGQALHHAPGAAPLMAPKTRRAVLGWTAGGALAVAGGGVFVWKKGWVGGGAVPNSVAVLPFANLSGDPEQAYFSDGLAAEVRSALSRNTDLQVAGQTSSNMFKASADKASTIAKKLDVAFLLEGSVRRSGNLVRVVAELTNGRSGFSEWSQTFDRPLTDIFAVQSEIATTVANALATTVATTTPGKTVPNRVGGTSNVAAFDAFLRGRALYYLATDENSDRAALAQFDAAIAADPKYAAAHSARARALTVIGNQYVKAGELASYQSKAIISAERAIAIAPDTADAYSTLGFILFYGQLNGKAARAPFERSLMAGRNDADVLIRYASFAAHTGAFTKAQEAIDHAELLDPLNPRVARTRGLIEYQMRNYAASITSNRKALAFNPKMDTVNSAVGMALLMLGDLPEARDAFAAETNVSLRLAGTAIVERKLGNIAAAKRAEASLLAEIGDSGLYQQAQVLAQSGDLAGAMAAFERAVSTGDAGVTAARADPMLDSLRRNPKFSRLLNGIGLD